MRTTTRTHTGAAGSKLLALLLPVLVLAIMAFAAPSALAIVPAFSITTVSGPTNLPPGGEGKLLIEVFNLGSAPLVGESNPIAMTDQLPAGLTATAAPGCEITPSAQSVHCETRGTVPPYRRTGWEITVAVANNAPASPVNEVNVSGGGAVGIVSREALKVSSTPAGYEVESLQFAPTNEDGTIDTQAGSHPFQLTTTLNLATRNVTVPWYGGTREVPKPAAFAKDLHFNLPAGVFGNPQITPQCTNDQFGEVRAALLNGCPFETAIGVASATLGEDGDQYIVPLFNLVPEAGEPARFGFEILGVPVFLDTAVRTGGDYGVVVSVDDISELAEFYGSQVSIWGTPADPVHNKVRGWGCLYTTIYGEEEGAPCIVPEEVKLKPFLTLPTSCEGPAAMRTTVEADSWREPGVFKDGEAFLSGGKGGPLGMDGCNQLPFEPTISAAPDTPSASAATGLTTDVHIPQSASLNDEGLAESSVRDITVALPEGVAINPSGADGLEACSESEVGFTGKEAGEPATNLFTRSLGEPFCPNASKIGTVKVRTPLLPNPLEGALYLGAQTQNPFGSLVAMYLVAQEPVSGTLIKLAGEVSLNQTTGQVTATFKNSPQLPFEDAELHFFGGERAPLASPAHCGSYQTDASFAPWSGTGPVNTSSTFELNSGPGHGACPGATLPFAPTLHTGSSNIQAGAFTPFTLTMSREDGNQNLQAIQLHMPPGLLGTLGTVKLCGEAQANAGTCGPDSLIGHTIVSVGVGGHPYAVKGGQVFITTGYGGAPYGLSIVNPAKAGPFDLGNVVVRAKIEVNPTTAELTITTDNSGPYKIPRILDGIPLQIQHIQVSIDRPEFTFNPTNCDKMAITGTLSSVEGSTAVLPVPFQDTNCRALGFNPTFSVSTAGHTSRKEGASLDVKLNYPKGSFGSQANLQRVKVELPKQLPSRLSTLQKACTAKVFNANPSSCPAESKIGEATASTPIIPVPLAGPAYFVSNGGAKFPELIIALSGYGVTVYIHGETFISKAGVTSSTFSAVPDVPIGSFELKLPEGPYSALGANTNLCTTKLAMPTQFVAQDGVEIKQITPISVTGCPKVTKVKIKHHKKKGKGKKTGKRANHKKK